MQYPAKLSQKFLACQTCNTRGAKSSDPARVWDFPDAL